MKRFSWPTAALVAVLVAAFLVQATSTWKLGQHHRLADLALPALVVLLEVGSVTTAAIFFSARSRGLRLRALGLLAVTAGLGAYGGVRSYGVVLGVFVAVMLLGLVEVVGAYRREERSTPVDDVTDRPDVDHEPVDGLVRGTPTESDRTTELRDLAARSPHLDEALAAIQRLGRVDWPPPHREPASTMHVAGYTGTVGDLDFTEAKIRPGDIVTGRLADEQPDGPRIEATRDGVRTIVSAEGADPYFIEPDPTSPLPRLVDTVPADVRGESDPPAAEELLARHEPTEADYAAQLLDAEPRDGKRLTERQLLHALRSVAPGVTRYRVKTYLGNTTRRLEAV